MQPEPKVSSQTPATRLATRLIQALRRRLRQPAFLDRHRRDASAFTRQRALGFPLVLLFILQKSVKSLQSHLHEFLDQWRDDQPPGSATNGAFTRARAKLRHSAYVELNTEILLPLVYHLDNAALLRRWQGHRLLAVDSSLVRLPNAASLATQFGVLQCGNQRGKSSVCFPQARLSVLYDVLNHFGWDARLEPHATAETQMARAHLAAASRGDVILCDRGYAGLFWFLLLQAKGLDFVVRCSKGSFGPVQELFRRDAAGVSCEVVLEAAPEVKPELRAAGLKLKLRVRLVTLRLDTGELEVLATSLLDPQRYPTAEFAQVYHWRWGIETYYHRLKARLDLENWSGKTALSIQQDFQAAVFLSNLESVLGLPAEQELAAATAHRPQAAKPNRAVGLHTIKNKIIALLAGRRPVGQVLAGLFPLLRANPVSGRPKRKVPRRETPTGQSYQFQRNVRKIVF